MTNINVDQINLFPHENTIASPDADNIKKFGIQTTFKTANKDSKYVNLSCAMLGVLKPSTIGIVYSIFSNSVSFRTVKQTLKKSFTRTQVDNAFVDLFENEFYFKVICRDGSKSEDLFFVSDKPFTEEEITFCLSNLILPITDVFIKNYKYSLEEIKSFQLESMKKHNTYAFSNLVDFNELQMSNISSRESNAENEQLTTIKKTTINKTTNNKNNKSNSETVLNNIDIDIESQLPFIKTVTESDDHFIPENPFLRKEIEFIEPEIDTTHDDYIDPANAFIRKDVIAAEKPIYREEEYTEPAFDHVSMFFKENNKQESIVERFIDGPIYFDEKQIEAAEAIAAENNHIIASGDFRNVLRSLNKQVKDGLVMNSPYSYFRTAVKNCAYNIDQKEYDFAMRYCAPSNTSNVVNNVFYDWLKA